MTVRPLFLAALSLAMLAAPAARALTFEDAGSGQKSDDTSMFYNDGKSDPATARLKSGEKNGLNQGTGFYFSGPRQNFEQRYDSNRYFTPNYLMGK